MVDKGVRLKVRGNSLTLDSGVRDDVRSRRISKVKPFKDRSRASDAGYVFSLPAANGGRRYFARDVEGAPSRQMQIFFGRGEDDPEAEAVVPELEQGDYYLQNTYDAVHVYKRAADEAGAPTPALNDLPARLAAQNRDNAAFWKRQMSGDAPHSAPPNAQAIASALAAVMLADGVRDTPQAQQAANAAVNALHRNFYADGGQQDRAHDAPRPKGFATPAQINAKNRSRWQTGRQ